MIFISRYIVPKGYLGLTIFPFVFLKTSALKEDAVLVNHEKIHLRQQLELVVLPFYLLYVLEFFVRLLQYKNWHLAYRNISFEREAYANEKHLDYLKQRPFWHFLKYLCLDGFQSGT
ncbi:hypothetical protein [Mariniflexile maritimum]|jgi:hypothetical protein|uniref:hypothetical protein n=1 Tax=Mariniflexile maritimum TaxID=2682493 RepID=UPI0012F62F86|nr:hypothetical protein [Mariniflexile maritimum]MCB0449507.1 hypothetical protein [Confluentibacter sp.]HMQ43099.1 hypothetical protein [Mariniflexile sp.]HMR16687.1 hypothetical protein [Mariniflexile sp.]